MEPQIRYVRSADGTRIATYTIGESRERPPFIYMPVVGGLGSDVGWATPGGKSGLTRIAEHRQVVWFDARGTGLSDRDVASYSLDAWVDDLEAVASRTSEGPVDLCCRTLAGAVAVTYAARSPGRVRRLILWSSIVAGRDFKTPLLWRLTAPLAEVDFEFFIRVRLLHAYGWTETGRRLAEDAIGSITPEAAKDQWAAVRAIDGSDQLGHVQCPTLVVHQTGNEWIPMETARRIAAAVPNARILTVSRAPSDWPAPFPDEPEDSARIMLEFLDEDAPADTSSPFPEGTAVILFADIADSTALTERMGDAAFRSQSRSVDDNLRAIIREHSGVVVEGKVLGDGVMAVFTSTARAIECAVGCHDATLGSELKLRIGLHAGDVIPEEDNVYGGAVNIASRVASEAAAGETLVSGTVRDLARTSAGVAFEDRGERELKGVSEPVRLFAVGWRD
jgi:class 3 adenylate cyclase/pimeloyl-ACP methyl ester carboxylesterase